MYYGEKYILGMEKVGKDFLPTYKSEVPVHVLGGVTGEVINVHDGDTFGMRTDEPEPARLTIRIRGLECPESGAYGYQHAKRILEDLILGKRVEVDISIPTGSWGGATRYVTDVTYDGGDLAEAMKRATGGVCL